MVLIHKRESFDITKKWNERRLTMQDKLSDFLKTAYEHGKVKELKEAFEKYPVKEECYKGKIEEYRKSFYDNLKNKTTE